RETDLRCRARRIKEESAECKMMSDKLRTTAFHSALRTLRSSFSFALSFACLCACLFVCVSAQAQQPAATPTPAPTPLPDNEIFVVELQTNAGQVSFGQPVNI